MDNLKRILFGDADPRILSALYIVGVLALCALCFVGAEIARQQGLMVTKAAQANGPAATETVPLTQTAQATETETPTEASTQTPAVTSTSTLEPISVIPTSTIQFSFVEVQRFQGTGKSTTDLFSLKTGIARVKWNYSGTSNFTLYIKRLDNGSRVMLENTIGSADGQSIFNVGESDQYLFDVFFADGDWTITVEYRP